MVPLPPSSDAPGKWLYLLTLYQSIKSMLNHKKAAYILFLALFGAAVMMRLPGLRGQNQSGTTSSAQENPNQNPYPLTEYTASEPSNPQKKAIRHSRGKRNNLRFANSKDSERFRITERAESSWGGPPFDVPPESALPASESEAVVIGEVTDAKAYLSEDKTNIYSEFTVNINEVLKDNSSALLTPGTSIDAERYGGAVRFPSGKVIKRGANGKPFPRVGRRYLFFLNYNNEGQDFSIITAYELRAGRVFPLDGLSLDDTVLPQYAAYQNYKDAEEAAFLNDVRDAVTRYLGEASPTRGVPPKRRVPR
jgi:hypothetical protein